LQAWCISIKTRFFTDLAEECPTTQEAAKKYFVDTDPIFWVKF